MTPLPYLYRWDRQGRKGQPCKVLARGTLHLFCNGLAFMAAA